MKHLASAAFAAAGLFLVALPTPSYAQDCRGLRWACEHKDELGLQGAGTCRHYREECGGGGGGGGNNQCAQLRWACEHKDELGLQGAGTCRRYREERGGAEAEAAIINARSSVGLVNTRMNSVYEEREPAGATERSVGGAEAEAAIINARSSVGLVNTRMNSVYKEREPAGAIEKLADKRSNGVSKGMTSASPYAGSSRA